MARTVLKCPQQMDETGTLEEFTSDLTNIADIDDVQHLTLHGLPRIRIRVQPGMLLIGKVGRRKVTDGQRSMNEIEQLTASREQLRTYWRQRAYDGSVYAPDRCFGTVIDAYFESSDGNRQEFLDYESASGVAVVEIELDQ